MNVTKQLYQWDTGQKLTECTGIYVDYLIGDEVYRVEITDGTCIIPDELLQTSGRYKVWECMADNTLREFAFKVLPRPIPPNYVFTPTEQLTFEGLVQKETNKFNTNAIEKLNAYNANADNRVAEFNAQAGQIQADVSELKSDLVDYNCTNLAKNFPKINTHTTSGVTIVDNRDGTYSFNGTATAEAPFTMVSNNNEFPSWLKKGETYRFKYGSVGVKFVFWCYKNGTYHSGFTTLADNEFTIPLDIDSVLIRYRVDNGTTVNETVGAEILSTLSNRELDDKIENAVSALDGKIESVNDKFDSNDPITGEGNVIRLENTSADKLNAFSIEGTSNANCYGKNIYANNSVASKTINGVAFTFGRFAEGGWIKAVSDGCTADCVSGNSSFTINGESESMNYMYHAYNDCVVTISPNADRHMAHNDKCYLQITKKVNGIKIRESIKEENHTICMTKGDEFGLRVFCGNGWAGEITFQPQVEIGSHATAYENYKRTTISNADGLSRLGTTTLIAPNEVASISVSAKEKNVVEKTEENNSVIMDLLGLTGGRIGSSKARYKNRKPIVSFIDDDTNNIARVSRIYNIAKAKGVHYNFATITKNLAEQTGLSQLLLDYEKEGFGILYHVYEQQGANPDSPGAYYREEYRDIILAEDNFVHGLRDMHDYGFSSYKYWVAPFGVNDIEMINLAKRHGMECLFTMGQYGHVSAANADRWSIPRYDFSPSNIATYGIERFKNAVDACVADCGWYIVVTHVNTWDSTTTMDTALGNAIQYALDSGCEVKAVPEAFEDWRAFFMLNEIL